MLYQKAACPKESHPKTACKKAAFFDRDGVINVNHGYVHTIADFQFMDGVIELMLYVQSLGYEVVVVTNQSGIARGMYTEEQFTQLNQWMCAQLLEQGVVITDTYYCPHHPSAGHSALTQDCTCRKPKPGMLLQAADKHGYDLLQSILIGDNKSDMQCAINAQLRAGYWLFTHTAEADQSAQIAQLSLQTNHTQLLHINELRECLHLI
jgi:D-glycero-D-manno-heptose 1,7-bisphosphate phosphatase